MGDVWHGEDGITVQAVRLYAGGHHLVLARMFDATAEPGEDWLAVTQDGIALGYVRAPAQLSRWVDLAALEPAE